jgi:hypothetical protein
MTHIAETESLNGEAEAAAQASPVVHQPNEASNADRTATEGGKRRKGQKQPKSKPAAENKAADIVLAPADEMADQAGGNAEGAQAGKEELGKPADDVLTSYPNLAAWPANAGPVPLQTHLLTARALGMGAGTKRELAVAAYLRDEAGQFTLTTVAEALRAVLGGEFNVQRNVANSLQSGGFVKVTKGTTEGGASYHLELTEKGQAKVNEGLAERETK